MQRVEDHVAPPTLPSLFASSTGNSRNVTIVPDTVSVAGGRCSRSTIQHNDLIVVWGGWCGGIGKWWWCRIAAPRLKIAVQKAKEGSVMRWTDDTNSNSTHNETRTSHLWYSKICSASTSISPLRLAARPLIGICRDVAWALKVVRDDDAEAALEADAAPTAVSGGSGGSGGWFEFPSPVLNGESSSNTT